MLGRPAFIFPGQGTQYVGMGYDLWRHYDIAKQTFAEADEALGFSLSRLCFEGSEDDLKQTENAQPAILTVASPLTAPSPPCARWRQSWSRGIVSVNTRPS